MPGNPVISREAVTIIRLNPDCGQHQSGVPPEPSLFSVEPTLTFLKEHSNFSRGLSLHTASSLTE